MKFVPGEIIQNIECTSFLSHCVGLSILTFVSQFKVIVTKQEAKRYRFFSCLFFSFCKKGQKVKVLVNT